MFLAIIIFSHFIFAFHSFLCRSEFCARPSWFFPSNKQFSSVITNQIHLLLKNKWFFVEMYRFSSISVLEKCSKLLKSSLRRGFQTQSLVLLNQRPAIQQFLFPYCSFHRTIETTSQIESTSLEKENTTVTEANSNSIIVCLIIVAFVYKS